MDRPGEHHRPGAKGAPNPDASRASGTWKPRRGPNSRQRVR